MGESSGVGLVTSGVQSLNVPQVLLMASSVCLCDFLRRRCLGLRVLESPSSLALLPIQDPILASSLPLHLSMLKLVSSRPDLSSLRATATTFAAAAATASAFARAGAALRT